MRFNCRETDKEYCLLFFVSSATTERYFSELKIKWVYLCFPNKNLGNFYKVGQRTMRKKLQIPDGE